LASLVAVLGEGRRRLCLAAVDIRALKRFAAADSPLATSNVLVDLSLCIYAVQAKMGKSRGKSAQRAD